MEIPISCRNQANINGVKCSLDIVKHTIISGFKNELLGLNKNVGAKIFHYVRNSLDGKRVSKQILAHLPRY